ncbi:MAG: PDZ domain-containing protein [Parafilimonas sp.]|nr:PDZ domain-containing protein [Parafilimonas sp.]
MIKLLKPIILLLALSFNLIYVHAQDAENSNSNDENIIIHKKDSTKEKVTVVIDGNNVTVNGKPIEDFKSDDIDIIHQKMDWDNNVHVFSGGDFALAPAAPQIEAFRGDMMHKIKTNSAFLGVMTDKTEQGAKITEVTEGSAAEKAGLKENDIITKIAEDKVTGPDDLYKAVGKHKPDEKVTITYLRDGKQATATATLAKAEQMKVYSWNTPGDAFNYNFNRDFNRNGYSFAWDDKPRLGISAQDTEDGNGVKILDLDDEEDSPAAKAGLKEGDIITQVNGKAITSTEDLRQSVKDVKKGDTLKITYKRNNQAQTVDVKFPKDLKTIDL